MFEQNFILIMYKRQYLKKKLLKNITCNYKLLDLVTVFGQMNIFISLIVLIYVSKILCN